MLNSTKNITGVILAGGRSSRFGSDKARAHVWPGRSVCLLKLLCLRLEKMGLSALVITNQRGKYQDLNLIEACDLVDGKGPIGGLYTALMVSGKESVLILSCDMPCVSVSLLSRLIEVYKDEGLAATLCSCRGVLQPFPGIYMRSNLEKIVTLMGQNKLGMSDLLHQMKGDLSVICADDFENDFFNMNTKEDYLRIKDIVMAA